jgi:hypothetical protein
MHSERTNRRSSGYRARSGLLGLLALAGWGCTTVQQGGAQRTALMEATGAKSSAADLRAMSNVLAISVPGIIETTADQIGAQSPDAASRRRALLWKIEVIPAFYQALFYSDPLAAVLDSWSLSIQLEEAVSSGAWREQLGSLQPIAADAAHRIRMQIETGAKATAKTAEGFDRTKVAVERWAREHPITGPISSRPSILPELTRMAAGGLDVSVFQVVADLPASIADLATRMDIYAAFLPKSARWQAELMAGDFADRSEMQRVLATLASVEKLTERTNALLSPAGLREALATASGQVRAEAVAALASVDQQRVDTLAYVTRERVAVFADIDRERDALVRQVEELRLKVRSDVDELSGRAIRQAAVAIALLLVLAAGLTLIVLWLASRMRARGSATT